MCTHVYFSALILRLLTLLPPPCTPAPPSPNTHVPPPPPRRIDPFDSIGYTMVTLINLGAGLSHYDYAMVCRTDYPLTTVFCTIYYLMYIATVVLLLMNLLTGEGRGWCV